MCKSTNPTHKQEAYLKNKILDKLSKNNKSNFTSNITLLANEGVPKVTAKQLHFNFSFISVFLFFFILVLACFYLFLGEDILDSAVYNRNDNTNGHTNGVSEDGPRFDSSSPIVPEYGARTLGKTKIFFICSYILP